MSHRGHGLFRTGVLQGTPTTSVPSLQRSSGSNKSFQKKPPGTYISLIRDHGEILKGGERSFARRCTLRGGEGSFYRGEGGTQGAWRPAMGAAPTSSTFMWVDTPLTQMPFHSLHSKTHSNSH